MQGFFSGFLILTTLFQAFVPCCALNDNCSGHPQKCDQCATSLLTANQSAKSAEECGECCCPERLTMGDTFGENQELDLPTPPHDEKPGRQCPYCSGAVASVMTGPIEIRISGSDFHALSHSAAVSSSNTPCVGQFRLAATPPRETCCALVALGKLVL